MLVGLDQPILIANHLLETAWKAGRPPLD